MFDLTEEEFIIEYTVGYTNIKNYHLDTYERDT